MTFSTDRSTTSGRLVKKTSTRANPTSKTRWDKIAGPLRLPKPASVLQGEWSTLPSLRK